MIIMKYILNDMPPFAGIAFNFFVCIHSRCIINDNLLTADGIKFSVKHHKMKINEL